jgi:adenosylhomocysteine nucleosidase
LQKELDFLVDQCRQQGFRSESGTLGRLPVVRLPELGLTVARGGVGKAQFALHTQHLVDAGSGWGLVICAGAAGALADELAVGDVVAATVTIEHDYNNKFVVRPKPRFEGDPQLLAGLEQAAPTVAGFKVYFGPVASGDEDIVDHERRAVLRQETETLAVAWEGAGGARACAFSQVPFVEVRGITDTADHNAPTSFETNLALAMGNIARLIIAWRNA